MTQLRLKGSSVRSPHDGMGMWETRFVEFPDGPDGLASEVLVRTREPIRVEGRSVSLSAEYIIEIRRASSDAEKQLAAPSN